MAVKIRLARHGSKGNPFYRIVVADSRSPARRPVYRADRDLRSAAGAFSYQGRRGEGQGVARQGGAAHRAGAQPAEDLRGPLEPWSSWRTSSSSWPARSWTNRIRSRSRGPSRTRGWISNCRVAPDDMGRVIGRQGRTIRAIRTVVKAASVKAGKRVTVEVPD